MPSNAWRRVTHAYDPGVVPPGDVTVPTVNADGVRTADIHVDSDAAGDVMSDVRIAP